MLIFVPQAFLEEKKKKNKQLPKAIFGSKPHILAMLSEFQIKLYRSHPKSGPQVIFVFQQKNKQTNNSSSRQL